MYSVSLPALFGTMWHAVKLFWWSRCGVLLCRNGVSALFCSFLFQLDAFQRLSSAAVSELSVRTTPLFPQFDLLGAYHNCLPFLSAVPADTHNLVQAVWSILPSYAMSLSFRQLDLICQVLVLLVMMMTMMCVGACAHVHVCVHACLRAGVCMQMWLSSKALLSSCIS